MEQIFDLARVGDQLIELLTFYGVNLVGAVVTLVAGWILARWAHRVTKAATAKVPWIDKTLRPMLASVAHYAVLVVTIVAVLNQFGVQTASIITVIGAAGLAIGLALQGTLSNVAAGIMILILRPFHAGDYVEAGGAAGTVQEVGLFGTEMATADNIYINVPNAAIIGSKIVNYSRYPERRLDIPVGIAYGSDIDQALAVLREMAANETRVLADPEVQARVTELGDNSVNLILRLWVKSEDYWAVKFDFTRQVKLNLDAAGIEIPFPQRVVHITHGENPTEHLN